MLVGARIAKKREKHETEHVKGGHARGDEADHPKCPMLLESAPENLVLAEESSQGRNAGDRQCGHEKGFRRNRNPVPQAAHFLNVLFTRHRMNHAACAEEQKRFEESVRHQMENTSRKSA